MLEFEKFKDEIVESIEKVELQQEKTNELLLKLDEKKQNELEAEVEEEEIELEEVEDESELEEEEEENVLEEEESELIEDVEENELHTLIEQNELLLKELEEMNQNQIESSWLISLTIIITLGFSYLVKQFSKW